MRAYTLKKKRFSPRFTAPPCICNEMSQGQTIWWPKIEGSLSEGQNVTWIIFGRTFLRQSTPGVFSLMFPPPPPSRPDPGILFSVGGVPF